MNQNKPWEKFYSPAAFGFDADNLPFENLVDLIRKSQDRFGSRCAVSTVLPDGASTTVTYAELNAYSDDFAAFLREVLQLGARDVVGIMTANCIGFSVAAFGTFKANCICTNINPLYTPPELEHQLNDSGARVLVVLDAFSEKVDAVIERTGVEHVVKLSLVDFFPVETPRPTAPAMQTAHTPMAAALFAGSRSRDDDSVAAYTISLEKDDTAVYQYTGGTTGPSKGAELTHRGILANAYMEQAMYSELLDNDAAETVLIALPLYHITAFTLLQVFGLGIGAHLLMAPSPRPVSNLKTAFEGYEVSWFIGINTLFAALINEPWFKRETFSSLKFCASGGAAQHVAVAEQWQQGTGVEVLEGYGMTEVCGVISITPAAHCRLGFAGVPVPGFEVKIMDKGGEESPVGTPGELWVRSPTVMKGYLHRPEATAEAIVAGGWLRSGDLATIDADGFLKIVDRLKDMILVSGFNVFPTEVECRFAH